MKVKCDYCGAYIDSSEEMCSHCGAVNSAYERSADGVPHTIEELKQWAQSHNLPLNDMRVFIGENYDKPKAFGIYKDGSEYVVYKNKANGQRSIRYQGSDEAYAVNELYMKMKEMVVDQKSSLADRKSNKLKIHSRSDVIIGERIRRRKRKKISNYIFVVYVLAVISIWAYLQYSAIHSEVPRNGYYTYNNETLYKQGSDWYRYNSNEWESIPSVDEELTENHWDYYDGSSYDYDSDYDNFKDSDYYDSSYENDWDSSWDSDDSSYDWDSSDSWSSGGTDWDSDW